MAMGMTPADDPRFIAATEMIGRTGASAFQIRYSDDEEPTIWLTVAQYEGDRFECAAGRDPLAAILRLCGQLIDGGICTHCSRPTGFSADLDALPLAEHVCWYQWDPELKTFRRGCEGEAR